METIEVIIAHGSRGRLERIKQLRQEQNGLILSDQEIVVAAIAAYWLLVEKRAETVKPQKVEEIYVGKSLPTPPSRT